MRKGRIKIREHRFTPRKASEQSHLTNEDSTTERQQERKNRLNSSKVNELPTNNKKQKSNDKGKDAVHAQRTIFEFYFWREQ